MQNKKNTLVEIPVDTHKLLKVTAAQHGVTMKKLMLIMLEQYIKNNVIEKSN